MAVRFEIDTAAGIVTLTAHGPSSVVDYMKAFEKVRKDPRCQPSMSTLVDMRDADHGGMKTPEIQQSADLAVDDPDRRRVGRVAIVVAGGLDYGMVRVYEMLRDRAPGTTRPALRRWVRTRRRRSR